MIGLYAMMLKRAETIVFEQMEQVPSTAVELGCVGLLLRQLAQDVDGCAAYSLAQADRIKAILERTMKVMPPQERGKVVAMIPSPPSSPDDYHLSRLQGYLDRLNDALIEVHAWLETAEGPVRDDLLDQIWACLEDQARHEGRLVHQLW